VPSGVAPPNSRSATVAFPSRILLTKPAFVVDGSGTRQTLSSYLSRQTVPTATASAAQLVARVASDSAPLEIRGASAAGALGAPVVTPAVRRTIAIAWFIDVPFA
jgi:hypothetical protein